MGKLEQCNANANRKTPVVSIEFLRQLKNGSIVFIEQPGVEWEAEMVLYPKFWRGLGSQNFENYMFETRNWWEIRLSRPFTVIYNMGRKSDDNVLYNYVSKGFLTLRLTKAAYTDWGTRPLKIMRKKNILLLKRLSAELSRLSWEYKFSLNVPRKQPVIAK